MKMSTMLIALYALIFLAQIADAGEAEGVSPAALEFHAIPGSEGNLPFSDAVRAGDLLFVSGKLGIPPGTRGLVDGGIGPETRQTLENIKATLERLGSGMDRVAKCTVFLADMAEWPAMNEVYRTFFTHPPARSAVAVSGLALDARVEIECIAMR